MASYALVMQLAYPTVAAGVRDHSDYTSDPWGRLFRTLDFVTLMIYGGPRAPEVGRRLRAMHRSIRGRGIPGDLSSSYSALEPESYAWVHATLFDAMLKAHDSFGRPFTEHERASLFCEWLGLGRLLGIRSGDLPAELSGFREYFSTVVDTRLVPNESIDAFLEAARRPAPPPGVPDRLWRPLGERLGQVVLAAGMGLLEPGLRSRLGVTWRRRDQLIFETLSDAGKTLSRATPGGCMRIGPAYLKLRAFPIAKGSLGPGSGSRGEK